MYKRIQVNNRHISLGYDYDIIDGGIEFDRAISVSGADPDTFVEIGNAFGKDKNNVYFEGIKVEDIDAKTFSHIMGLFGKDKNNIYYTSKKIKEVDYDSFEVILTKEIQKCKNKSLEEIKRKSPSWDDEIINVRLYIDLRYSKDKNNIYFGADKIKDVDYDSFEVILIKEFAYAKDKNNVYCYGKKLEGCESDIFEIISESYGRYSKDKNNIYSMYNRLEDVDYGTFRVVPDSYGIYAKDKNNIYYNEQKLKDVDYETFEAVSYGSAKDKYGEFYGFNRREKKGKKIIKLKNTKLINKQ
jgi:hypothetical protein